MLLTLLPAPQPITNTVSILPASPFPFRSFSHPIFRHYPNSSLLPQRLHPTAGRNFRRRSRSRFLPRKPALGAPAAGTGSFPARANPRIASAAAGRLLGPGNLLQRLFVFGFAAAAVALGALVFVPALLLPGLQVRQAARFGVDVPYLLVALRVERRQLLARGRAEGFFEIGCHAPPARARFFAQSVAGVDAFRLLGNAVAGVQAFGFVARFVFGVELAEGVGEARAHTVFVVQSDGALDRIVAQCVAVGEIFGDDPRAGLVFLGDFGGVVGFVLGGRGGA